MESAHKLGDINKSAADLLCAGTSDLGTIWKWNASTPSVIEGSVHDLIAKWTRSQPNALAVDAWDGQFNYVQLDAASGRLAYALRSRGIAQGDIISIYLKKSKWMPIAMLGIIKAGATAVTLDTNHPWARLQSVLEQTRGRFVLTSSELRSHFPICNQWMTLVLDDPILGSTECEVLHQPVSSSALVYISFTSGTTGQPKGACMSHSNVCSAVFHQGKKLGFHAQSRVLDFAPYSFDVAWSNFLHTVCAGGCICIAPEHEMLEDLSSVLSSYQCTLINITPTILRTLLSAPSTLETILLSGEPPYPENITKWAHRVTLINTYGPTECTFKSAFSVVEADCLTRPSIGKGVGMCTWLVDTENDGRLVPIGATGELYLEGPLVGQGYIGSAEQTSSAFIDSPAFLLEGCKNKSGRRGTLYRTGDLFKYTEQGDLIFVGRKDTAQVKIRGQRVEIADVEQHVRAGLPSDYTVLVDVVKPVNQEEHQLALFIETTGHALSEIQAALQTLQSKMTAALPAFMHPTLYYPLDRIPRAATGKADRGSLRQRASAMDVGQLRAIQATVFAASRCENPRTGTESNLRNIWANVLQVPAASISTGDNFLRLGGNSVKAIEMIAAARERGLGLSIVDIFQTSTLRDLAGTVKLMSADRNEHGLQPFSLLDSSLDRSRICQAAADSLRVRVSDIEDILPCTPMQQGLIAMTSASATNYVWESTYQLPPQVDLERLRFTWQKVIRSAPLLRTRITHAPHGDLVQVVISANDEALSWYADDSGNAAASTMGLGTPLFKLTMKQRDGSPALKIQMHHAVFDGWSRSLIFNAVQRLYHQSDAKVHLASFRPFVDHLQKQIERPDTKQYWVGQLRGCQVASFPPAHEVFGTKNDIHIEINDLQWSQIGITPSSTLRAALAILLSKYNNSDEIVFGATVSGREAPVPFMEKVAGPTFAIVPIRVQLDWASTASDLQLDVQRQMTEMHDYEQYGLRNIGHAANTSDLGEFGLFRLLLVVQQNIDHLLDNDEPALFPTSAASEGSHALGTVAPFNSHSIMLVASPSEHALSLDISHDTSSISVAECRVFAEQLEYLIRQLCASDYQQTELQFLPLMSQAHVATIRQWNVKSLPMVPRESVAQNIYWRARTHPHSLAVDAHDAKLSYRELWDLSSRLAHSLQRLDVRASRVPLCFEKSSWMALAILSVLRAGGTAVPLSASISADKARHVVDTCKSTLCITSRYEKSSSKFADIANVMLVEDLLDKASDDTESGTTFVDSSPADEAIIVFTSGTTSSAKAVLWSHSTLNCNVQAALNSFDLNDRSRVFQFAGYDFDVSTIETLAVLSAGGTLCIPDQGSLASHLIDAVQKWKPNWICLTPSVAKLLDPGRLQSLRTIVLAGEKVAPANVANWLDADIEVLVWYGPAEASVAASCRVVGRDWASGLIGKSHHARTWIIDTRDTNQLALIGTVGELCIEGPIVATGYIAGVGSNSAFTTPAAIQNVTVNETSGRSAFYRTGDLVKYDPDGNLVFLGRNSHSWVKVHGRRVQLLDIEETAQSLIHDKQDQAFVADLVQFADADGEHLALFILAARRNEYHQAIELDSTVAPELCCRLRQHLARTLPAYMIPTYLIPVSAVPLSGTGKIDRGRLRQFAKTLSRQQIAGSRAQQADNSPSLPTEKTMAILWTKILHLELGSIRRDDHFFHLGGDSIDAMRLVAIARQQNLRLTTADVFQNPLLHDLANISSWERRARHEEIPPFSLLSPVVDMDAISISAASQCNISVDQVEDIYPCTPLQQGLLSLTARSLHQYVSRSVLELQDGIDAAQLEQAWYATVAELEILRTRIVDLPKIGLAQVVLKDWKLSQGFVVNDYLREDEKILMSLGDALCRGALIGRCFVLTIHHSIYDGTFLSILFEKLQAKYFAKDEDSVLPFRAFVRHVSESIPPSEKFWAQALAASDYESFPQLPPDLETPRANREHVAEISVKWPRSEATRSIILLSAWTLLAAKLSMKDQVVFGTVLSGRQIELLDVERCAGPTVCTIPVAYSVAWYETIEVFHQRLRRQNLNEQPYQHYGVHNIARTALRKDPRELFQTLFVVHPEQTGKTLLSDSSLFRARSYGATLATLGSDPFNTHALMVSCWLSSGGLRLALSFDDKVLSLTQVEIVAKEFERVLQRMCQDGTKTVREITSISSDTLHHFWSHRPSKSVSSVKGGAQVEECVNYSNEQNDMSNGLSAVNGRFDTSHRKETINLESHHGERGRALAASLCGISPDEVEDMYPCTALQESLVALAERRPGDYIGHDTLTLASSVDHDSFCDAWETLVRATPLLRTRIVEVSAHGLIQVVTRSMTPWSTARTVHDFRRESETVTTWLGLPLCRYGIVGGHTPSRRVFALTMHHAMYDGITNVLIRESLEAIYGGRNFGRLVPFKNFINHLTSRDVDAERDFWSEQFDGLEMQHFPALPSQHYQARPRSVITCLIEDLVWRKDDTLSSTIVRAAWALLCSKHSGSDDVVFGTIASGRQASLTDIDRVCGPTIAALPIRMRIDSEMDIETFLHKVQTQAIAMIPFEQTGIPRISAISESAREACSYHSLLIVQPRQTMKIADSILFEEPEVAEQSSERYQHFNSHALMAICTLGGRDLKLQISFDPDIVDCDTATLLTGQLDQTVRELCHASNETRIRDLFLAPEHDLDQIWKWNSPVHQIEDVSVLDMIKRVALQTPDAIAISAWDGELTYQQLDQTSVTIAKTILDWGVDGRQIVPICFEKSLWTAAAFLGVAKAGHAVLILEPSLPEGRMREILKQIQPQIMLCSNRNRSLCSKICDKILCVDRTLTPPTGASVTGILPRLTAQDSLYLIFTSGSTGTPKGCMITHGNMSTAVVLQRECLRLNESTRMYDFCAYSFDPHHWGLIHTLCAGGTLCVPSDEEKQNRLMESLQSHRVTDVICTPAMAKMVDPTRIPTLRNAFLGGDRISSDEIKRWAAHVRLIIVYGPSETTCCATTWAVPWPVPDHTIIGKGNGLVTWVTDPNNVERLAPLGSIGELCLEGPLVGAGYFKSPEHTRVAFLDPPSWLVQGWRGSAGRKGRLYRTGDLVRYNASSGDLFFVGRKDQQTKINGHRIELGAIEENVTRFLKQRAQPPLLAAEVVFPKALCRPILMMFIQASESEWHKYKECLDVISNELSRNLPPYMVPHAYERLSTMPVNSSGKINRKMLRDIGRDLSPAQLITSSNQSKITPPETSRERVLQQLWSRVLHIARHVIGQESNYFHMSGDSITAMQLMTAARRKGFLLPVTTILANPCFSDMAKEMKQLDSSKELAVIQPFSLLNRPSNFQETRRQAAQQCDVDTDCIEDCYPCTAVQKSLLAVTYKRPGDCITHFKIELGSDIDLTRLQTAWHQASNTVAPILRNRIVDVHGEGFIQAQLKVSLDWSQHDDIEAFRKHVDLNPMSLGTSLTRLAIVNDHETKGKVCILSQHHAVYDAVSISLLLRAVHEAYLGDTPAYAVVPFQRFFQHAFSTSAKKKLNFWRKQFSGCKATAYPSLPHEGYQPQAKNTVTSRIATLKWPTLNLTPAIAIRAAWTVLSSCYTDSVDVVFGILSNGRQAPVEGIEHMIAPLIAALPLRVAFERTTSVHDLLHQLQQQSIEMTPYEQSGMHDIHAVSEDARIGARFNSIVIIQSPEQAADLVGDSGPFVRVSNSFHGGELNHVNAHALMVMFQLEQSGGVKMEINFDPTVLHPTQADLLPGHFETILRQICASSPGDKVEDVSPLNNRDLEILWRWNTYLPEPNVACIQDMFSETASLYPESQALCAWDGQATYHELDSMSDALARLLLDQGVVTGDVIPLCFEKSMWQPVAALAAIKAGAVCVSMDCTQPEGRLRAIVDRIGPKYVLASTSNAGLAQKLFDAQVIVVSQEVSSRKTAICTELPQVKPHELIYVVFTSGSTGVPKGVTVTHQNFATAVMHQREQIRVGHGTRVFDFVSYSFDVAWSNMLNTLICGGCLCIPSEEDRKNDISGAFNRLKANYSYFTPTVARTLDPLTLPDIRVLAMGGEAIPSSEIDRWPQVETVIGIYGPAECAQAFCITELSRQTPSQYVGRPFGARAWLIEPGRIDRLAPIGALGELVIEGPAVATGYWKDDDLTRASFLDTPSWLSARTRSAGKVYRTGDLLRYNALDGSMIFVGRKDQMVKLRGQRIELSEVEQHVQTYLRMRTALCKSIAAEIITPCNSLSPILAVFLALTENSMERLDRTFRLSRALNEVEEDLQENLPQYMIPGAYIILDEMPMTTTDKIDRRALRQLGGQKKLEDLASMQLSGGRTSHKAPSTDMEKRIQKLWAQVLGIDPSSIQSQSSFLRIGGESISAMRLVAAARQNGISFTVADVFRHPRLCQLAELAKEIPKKHEASIEEFMTPKPFSLLESIIRKDPMSFLAEDVVPLLGDDIDIDDVQDMLPASNFQSLAIREALQDPPGRLPHFILDLPGDVDVPRLRRACKTLIEHCDILRTIFIEMQGTVWQVRLSHLNLRIVTVKAQDGDVGKTVERVCHGDLRKPRLWGSTLVAIMVITSAAQESKLVLRMSHAQFDDHSIGAMLQTLTSLYLGDKVAPPRFGFGALVLYNAQRKTKCLEYWRARLQACPEPLERSSMSVTCAPEDRLSFSKSISMAHVTACRGIPLATIFHAACAIALSRHFDQEEVILGRLTAGRAALPGSLQEVIGPCLVELPIRCQVSSSDDIWSVSRALQTAFLEDATHDAVGMVDMIRAVTSWPSEYSDFGWRTSFQQADDKPFLFLGKADVTVTAFERPQPSRCRPEIYAMPSKGRLQLSFEGNKLLHEDKLVRKVVDEVAVLLETLSV